MNSGQPKKYLLYAIGEVALVVLGILIALQINNWNEARKAVQEEKEFLKRLKTDLEYDIEIFNGDSDYLQIVYEEGLRALKFMDSGGGCGSSCVTILVAFYNATQWIGLTPRKTTFNEISLTGYPSNQRIKDFVNDYHNSLDTYGQFNPPSEYRQHARSMIPPEIQKALAEACMTFLGANVEGVLQDCMPAINEKIAQDIVEELVKDPDTRTTLYFWLGTITILKEGLMPTLEEARKVIEAIDEELNLL